MFETFQTIINAGGYDLADLTERIKTLYAMGELTEDEMKQLLEQAQTNAKPDDSYAPLNERVTAIETWQREVEDRLDKLETGSSTEPGEPEEPADEWPEYVHLRRLCVDPGRLSAGVAARRMIFPLLRAPVAGNVRRRVLLYT